MFQGFGCFPRDACVMCEKCGSIDSGAVLKQPVF